MTTKNFNAKKMLMSAVAAVVFSFVFTTNANANTTPQGGATKYIEAHKCHKCHKCSKEKKQGQKQEKKQENKDVVSSMLQMFGIRVK